MSSKRRVKKTFSYYDYSKVLSYNAPFTFIVGARGLGKTYGAKRMVINAYLNHGEQFIYLRRYKTEMSARTTFFNDIAAEFPGYTFRVMGSEFQMTRDPDAKKVKWETMGYGMPLSNAQSKKSMSFEDVRTIIFDEFIIEKGAVRYLPDEAKVFNDFYSTVDRWQDKTRVLFLANALSIMNPYFTEYHIAPSQELKRYADGFIVAHFPDSAQFASEVRQTRFGAFIDGTAYGDYSMGNIFIDNNDALVKRKHAESEYQFTFLSKDFRASVWVYREGMDDFYFIQEKRPKGNEVVLTIDPALVTEGVNYVSNRDYPFTWLRRAFARGQLFFDTARSRNAFLEMSKGLR